MSERLTPERIADIREGLASGRYIGFSQGTVVDLLAELDAATIRIDDLEHEIGDLHRQIAGLDR